MYLAQELVDYIIDFLHDDPTTLLQVSLVSKAWVDRTRTHLCESLNITRFKLSTADASYLIPLCGYIRTLHFTWPTNITDPSSIFDRFEQSKPHTLVIRSCELHSLDEKAIRRLFTKFPCTSITALELHDISPTHKTLLILLSLFPNVDDLGISVYRWRGDEPSPGLSENSGSGIAQRISPPRFRGSLKFSDSAYRGRRGFDRGELLHTIAALSPQFQTISLDIEDQSNGELLRLLDSCSKTVRKVFVGLPYPSRGFNWPSDFGFSSLEELRIYPLANDPLLERICPFLRSVTSPCLRRVIIEVSKKEAQWLEWSLLDESLVDLVERHKACGNLVLQISTVADPERLRGLLPRATREAVLEVGFSERPDYCTH